MTTAMEEELITTIRESYGALTRVNVRDVTSMKVAITDVKNNLAGLIIYYDMEKAPE